SRERRGEEGAMPSDRGHPASCARCGRARPLHARGLCSPCYQSLWDRRRAALARYPAARARAAAVPPARRRLLAGLRALLERGGPGAAQLRALLAEARAARPRLILLNVRLPGLDGVAVCRRLRADPGTRGIPVVFVTADTGEVARGRLARCAHAGLLAKPFRLDALLAAVRLAAAP